MVPSLLKTIIISTTKTKATMIAVDFTLAEGHVKINQINVINLWCVLPGELYEIALELLALQTSPRQYLQRQQ
jgi:hypothetical protein